MENINYEDLYICNIVDKKNTKPSDHCFDKCGHCQPHYKDDCTGLEECSLHEFGNMIKVKCRKLRKKELKYLSKGIK